MISDIKVNYAIIGELRDKIATYKSAIETMEESLNNINSRLETENSGEAVAALISKHEDLKGDISACKGELEDLYKLFSGFHNEMTGIIHPMSYGAIMRVDRDDIWWNMQSIIGACTAIGIMRYNVSTYRSFPSFSDSKEEKENQERNYRKIEEIWDIINSYKSGFDSQIDYMNNLFNSKVVPYEEMDNNYASRAHETYTRYVTTWERIVDGIIDFSQMVGNFVDGVIKSVEDLIKGLVGLVIGVSVYAVGGVAVAITKGTGDTPDWLKGAEEDFYKDNEMIKAVLDDPSIIVEGIAQQVSDAKDEKGLAYCTGYTAGLIAQIVLLKKVKGGSGVEGVSEARVKYLETLKNGLVDDDAWKNLYKHAEKNDIDLGTKSFEWKLQKVEELKSEILADRDLMSIIQEKANNLLKLSDNRLSDAMASGYSAEDYYRVLNQEKSGIRAKEYMESLENSNLVDEWHNNFYGNDSKYVISYMSKNDYIKFVLDGKSIGRPGVNGGQFVLPELTANSIETKLADLGSIESSTTEFKRQLAKALGLPENTYNSGVVRVQIPIDSDIDLRIVSGVEDGCNYQWVPGTKTLGGTREGIIRQILESKDKDLYEQIINNSKVGN